jgi:hypothetical protein
MIRLMTEDKLFLKFFKIIKGSKKKFSITLFNAGWSSLIARQAHNLKVVGSNPTPAIKNIFH